MAKTSIELNRISAENIIHDILNLNELNIRNAQIIGDLNLSNVRIIYSSICIEDSIIEGHIDLSGVHFKGKIAFKNVTFYKDIRLISTQFDENLEIEGSSFLGDMYLASLIKGYASFGGSIFKNINIINTRFNKGASFRKITSIGDFYISDSIFLQPSSFQGSYFKSKSFFKNLVFMTEVEFKDVLFGDDAIFNNSIFEKDVNFNDSFFGGEVHLIEAKILKNAYFGSDKFTPIGVAFSNKLDLTDAEFNRLFITWDVIKTNLNFNKSAIVRLINNFEKIDRSKDADECYYYYRNYLKNRGGKSGIRNLIDILIAFVQTKSLRRSFSIIDKSFDILNLNKHNLSNSSKIYDYIEWAISGYGVKQERIIIIVIALITIFGLIFWLGNGICSDANVNNSLPIWTYESLEKSVIFSAICLIAKIPTDLRATGYYTFLALFESTLGWLILAIFISNLIEYNQRKKKRI